ncbi:MAG: hypothetical protein AAGA23_10985 [Pseudomonadota bacterium]
MNSENSLSGYTVEQLKGGQKTFLTLIIVLSILEALFLAYIAYLIATGGFDLDRHLLAVVPVVMISLAVLPPAINLGRYKRELARRSNLDA